MTIKKPPKPRLLVLTSTYPRWQGDHEPPFVHELARRLTDRFEVTVLAPHAPGALRRECLDGVEVERFRYAPERLERLAYDGGIPYKLQHRPWLGLLVPLFLLAQFIGTWSLLRRLRPSAVHAHWLLPQGLVALLVRRLSVNRAPVVVTAHGADLHGLRSAVSRRLKRLVLRSADAITVVSQAMADVALALQDIGDRLTVIPMGVDLLERFTPGPDRARGQTLVFAGRLVEKKGVTCLLEALHLLAPSHPDCRLLLAGSGPLERTLVRQAQRLGITDRVEFLGRYDNKTLPAILRRGDIAVFPFVRTAGGDQEGLGLVVIEAMGCGLPVIAGDVTAVHDIVRDRETGCLAPPRDPHALASVIDALLRDPRQAGQLAHAGRAYVMAHFEWRSVAARYATVLGNGTATS
jgi:glycosyltransferase involved in cell wall biosynthesis